MPLKRSQSQYNGLKFWQYTWKGKPVLIRLAWNGAAVISDLSVLCGGWNSLAGSACGLLSPNLGEWFDLVSSPAGVGEITESKLGIVPAAQIKTPARA